MCGGDCFASKSCSRIIHIINTIILCVYGLGLGLFYTKCKDNCHENGIHLWFGMIGVPVLLWMIGFIIGMILSKKGESEPKLKKGYENEYNNNISNYDYVSCLGFKTIINITLLCGILGGILYNIVLLIKHRNLFKQTIYGVSVLILIIWDIYLIYVIYSINKYQNNEEINKTKANNANNNDEDNGYISNDNNNSDNDADLYDDEDPWKNTSKSNVSKDSNDKTKLLTNKQYTGYTSDEKIDINTSNNNNDGSLSLQPMILNNNKSKGNEFKSVNKGGSFYDSNASNNNNNNNSFNSNNNPKSTGNNINPSNNVAPKMTPNNDRGYVKKSLGKPGSVYDSNEGGKKWWED